MSPASASVTTSASRPSITARACLPEPPCDCLIVTVSPVFAFQYLAKAVLIVLVELARRVVGDVEQLHVRAGCGRAGEAGQHGNGSGEVAQASHQDLRPL